MMFYGYLLQARPTMYQVVKEMVDKMGYEVCFVVSVSALLFKYPCLVKIVFHEKFLNYSTG